MIQILAKGFDKISGPGGFSGVSESESQKIQIISSDLVEIEWLLLIGFGTPKRISMCKQKCICHWFSLESSFVFFSIYTLAKSFDKQSEKQTISSILDCSCFFWREFSTITAD